MNFLAIRNEIELKFDVSIDASVKKWVNLFEAELWEAADWQFKRVPPVGFDVTAGVSKQTPKTNTVTIADFEDIIALYDNTGEKLTGLSPRQFDEQYMSSIVQGVSSTPEAYKVESDGIYIGPIPSSGGQSWGRMSYWRKLSSLTSLGAVQVGPMTADTDTPIFDASHHMIYVWGGMRIGMRLESDLTYIGIDDLYQEAFGALSEAFDESTAGEHLEFGADSLGYFYDGS